ncbi:MAG: ATP-binding protein [Bacteroidales bacterium]|nr:ATP-binding protein [Bacteroidales bacterium]MDD4672160.1 ATP-binding protein [Bacteroidales bacterium]
MDSSKSELRQSRGKPTNESVFPNLTSINDAFSTMPVGIWVECSDTSQNFWSKNLYGILHIQEDLASYPSLYNLTERIPLVDRSKFSDLLSIIKNGESTSPINIEFKYKSQEEQLVSISLTAEPVLNDNNIIECWQGAMQDITSALQFESVYRNSAQSLAGFLNQSPLLTLVFDQNASLFYWNKLCSDLTGYSMGEASNAKEVYKALFPEKELRKQIRDAIRAKDFKPFEREVEAVDENGDSILCKWFFYVFTHDDERNVAAVGQNIKSYKTTEEQLSARVAQAEMLANIAFSVIYLPENESYFHHLGVTLENNIPDAYYIVSSVDSDQQFFTIEGGYGFAQDEWEQVLNILGWTPVGRRFQFPNGAFTQQNDLLIHEYDESLYDYSHGVISSAASRSLERALSIYKIYTVGLFYESTLMGWVLVLAKSNEFKNHLHLIQDITNIYSSALHRMLQEQKVARTKAETDEVSKQKSMYLSNFGHEIRVPLNAILGFTKLLNLPNLTKEKRQQYIDIISSKGHLLVKLINDMVDVSNVELGQLTVVKTYFDLNKLLRTLNDFYCNERVFQNREAVEVSLNIPDKHGAFMLYTDEGRLEQVLTNLLDNALKYTEKGFVEFGYSVANQNVEFVVKDSGIGIDESMHLAIFNRYKQVANQLERTTEGQGLGLAISKGIIELLGGTIWVESEPEKGATFKFTIPITYEKHYGEATSGFDESRGLTPDWRNKVLLVAEDEEVNYLLVNTMLESTGVTILWARDGKQAVDLVASIKKIDAVLMDIRMPVKNGYAASLEIRQLNPNIPIIAQTAYAYTEDREKAIAAGCNDYITKPICSTDLIALLDRYLG